LDKKVLSAMGQRTGMKRAVFLNFLGSIGLNYRVLFCFKLMFYMIIMCFLKKYMSVDDG